MTEKREPTERHKYEVVEAEPKDAEGIAEVQKETWLATYVNEEFDITKEDILSKDFDSKDKIAELRKSIEKGGTWVVREDEKVIGFARGKKDEKGSVLRALYVHPDYQGKGIGTRLAEQVLEYLGTEKPVTLTVAKYNKDAIKFYEKLGFKPGNVLAQSPAAKLPSGKTIPEITMVMEFK